VFTNVREKAGEVSFLGSRSEIGKSMSHIRNEEALAHCDLAERTGASLQTRQGWLAVLRTVRRVLHGTNDAEDLLHSAFIRFAEYRDRETVANPAAFLVRTAANLAVDERRRRQRREIPAPVIEMMEVADEQPMPTEMLAAKERLENVLAGLDSLGARTREIFLMHRISGMKHRDIAARLGITVSAVEKHVAKASLFLLTWAESE
jgi:RNA polymerase sigma factor (sigma-70 family)